MVKIKTTAVPLGAGAEGAGAGECRPLVVHRVDDPVVLCMIRDAVRDLANDDRVARFPGPNPVSLDTSHFPTLRAAPYFVCEKTDGVRYALFCKALVVDGERVKMVALVDRAMTAYVLPLRHVPTAMFQGSLLDGELAWNKVDRRWDFLVFDAVCVSGVPTYAMDLRGRMDAVHRVLKVLTTATTRAARGAGATDDPVRVRAKTYWTTANFGDFESHVRTVPYDTDGAILTPARDPVVYGRHTGLFKLKGGSQHTVDFLVAPDGRGLMVYDAGRHARVDRLRDAHPPVAPGTIVECARDLEGPWYVVRVRTDKTTANDMFTYQKTLVNMEERLELGDVRRVFGV